MGVFVLDFSIVVIVKFDARYVQLYQTPQKPVDIRKRLEYIGFTDMLIHIAIFPVDPENLLFDFHRHKYFLEHITDVIVRSAHTGVLPINQINLLRVSFRVFSLDKVVCQKIVMAWHVVAVSHFCHPPNPLQNINRSSNIKLRIIRADISEHLVKLHYTLKRIKQLWKPCLGFMDELDGSYQHFEQFDLEEVSIFEHAAGNIFHDGYILLR